MLPPQDREEPVGAIWPTAPWTPRSRNQNALPSDKGSAYFQASLEKEMDFLSLLPSISKFSKGGNVTLSKVKSF